MIRKPTKAEPDDDGSVAPAAARCASRRRGAWVRRLRIIVITAAAILVAAAIGLTGAEYYTAQPNFCGTCHIMEPYFETWSRDFHGAKLRVRCVDCHYAPGERHTVLAKFRGLSQVTSYFSGRYGNARPRAHVSDRSCLNSACHGDGRFLREPLAMGRERLEERGAGGEIHNVARTPTVYFRHDEHLQVSAKLADTVRELSARESKLAQRLPAPIFARVEQLVVSVAPQAVREARLERLVTELGLSEEVRSEASALSALEHLRVRLRQLEGISCTGCHRFDASADRHLSVNRTACFTCHFTNQGFNNGSGECLKCHLPPVRMVPVHDLASPQSAATTLMDHRGIVERGIDCASCHFDVVRGQAVVTRRDCARCHDQDAFVEDFEARTTATVERYHRLHVGEQRAACDDCHRAIEHDLAPASETGADAGFLEPVLSDCRHCHPNHHVEQVEMLEGVGGVGADRSMPNAMFGSRLNCRACHIQAGDDFKGDPLVRATRDACVACHDASYAERFAQWRSEIDAGVLDAERAAAAFATRISSLRDAGGVVPQAALDALRAARRNIAFVQCANGIHNKNYALYLMDRVPRKLAEAERALSER